jgi:hypothetical protein
LGALASRGLFFGVMGSAAALSLLRGFAVAAILPIADFGVYAIIVAIGAFSSNFLGLGRIEDTRKRFPRLFFDGQGGDVPSMADRLALLLGTRALTAVALCTGFVWLTGRLDFVVSIAACGLIAFSTGWASVAISAHRATGDYGTLATSTLWRALLALALGLSGAWYGGWFYAIAGEFLGGVLGALISRSYVGKLVGRTENLSEAIPESDIADKSGFLLFLSFSICAAPFYLDRLFVGHAFGATAAGTYGFLMLFVTGATVALGIAEQQLGPDIVKLRKESGKLTDQMALALRWILPFQLLMIIGMATVGVIMFYGPGSFLVTKFGLNPSLILAIALLCCLQITTTLDWILQSRDREIGALSASIFYFFVVAGFALWVIYAELGLTQFIFGLAVAKACHIAAQSVALWMSARYTS